MTDTDLINEIIYKLKANNAGHFDRDNLLDSVIPMIEDMARLSMDSRILDKMKWQGLDGAIDRIESNLKANSKDII